ncbi:MAG: exo-alpha-sialidase [Anaerolineales bacterium]|nr:exo-alpha-sialidase [Anaerolineales bacterium]
MSFTALRPYLFICLGGVLLLLALAGPSRTSPVLAQAPIIWSPPVIISEQDRFNWFADIAIDNIGRPHVIWDGSLSEADKALYPDQTLSLLMYSRLEGDTWLPPLDINVIFQELGGGHIYRGALTADPNGNLFALYEGHLIQAPANLAGDSAIHWSQPNLLSRGAIYMGSSMADPNGVLHVLYDQETKLDKSIDQRLTLFGEAPPAFLAEIFYRRSVDGGKTWSEPLNMSRTQVGEHREKIKMDSRGVIYAAWDEGWDRLTEYGEREQGILRISRDGGETWSPKITFAYPERTNAQFTSTGDGRGGVLAVWRALTRDEIFYSWSVDDGATWSAPQSIPNILAREWNETRFDSYDLVADSGGVMHLVVVGRPSLTQPSRVYHLSWNGRSWSEPLLVHEGEGWPEWPRVVSSQGNRLHLVWFVRNRLETDRRSLYQIWYSSAITAAPAQPLPPTPTPTPTQTSTPAPVVVFTPTPVKIPISPGEMEHASQIRKNLMRESDDLLLLLQALMPLIIVLIGLGMGWHYWQGR